MCGIAAFFTKSSALEPHLGAIFAPMLDCLTGRGPDSAGFAIYRDPVPDGFVKVVAQHPDRTCDWERVFESAGVVDSIKRIGSHAVCVMQGDADSIRQQIQTSAPEVALMSVGGNIEIFKEVGLPCDVMRQFDLRSARGSHAIGHTRMATESAVTTAGSHPFSTGSDLCLVHNGSLSNHNTLRRNLRREGIVFSTDNDSEVAAGYLTWRLLCGDSLESALHAALSDLDGFFTFAVGTGDGFAVLRDPIACKPAVIAETDDYVAMASEYRSLAHLPGIDGAEIWEPEPAQVYSWSRKSEMHLAAV